MKLLNQASKILFQHQPWTQSCEGCQPIGHVDLPTSYKVAFDFQLTSQYMPMFPITIGNYWTDDSFTAFPIATFSSSSLRTRQRSSYNGNGGGDVLIEEKLNSENQLETERIYSFEYIVSEDKIQHYLDGVMISEFASNNDANDTGSECYFNEEYTSTIKAQTCSEQTNTGYESLNRSNQPIFIGDDDQKYQRMGEGFVGNLVIYDLS